MAIALIGAFVGAALWAIASHEPQTRTTRRAGGWRR